MNRVLSTFVIVCVSASFASCRPRRTDGSQAKDFDQIVTLTETTALCRDGSVYLIAKVGDQQYSVKPQLGGTAVVVAQTEILQTVCPAPGAAFSGRALATGRYVSIKGENGQKYRCDMTLQSFYDDGHLNAANASASALESDGNCDDSLNVYSFTCQGDGAQLTCSATSVGGKPIVLNNVNRYSFERVYDNKAHTFASVDAPAQPSNEAAHVLKSGLYTSPNNCDLNITAYYNGPQLSHAISERGNCGSLGRNVFACAYANGVPTCNSNHGSSKRALSGFTGNAFKIKFADGSVGTYTRQND